MKITLNGEARELISEYTVEELVRSLGIEPQTLVAEVNTVIYQHQDFQSKSLQDGDVVELIQFVGGG